MTACHAAIVMEIGIFCRLRVMALMAVCHVSRGCIYRVRYQLPKTAGCVAIGSHGWTESQHQDKRRSENLLQVHAGTLPP